MPYPALAAFLILLGCCSAGVRAAESPVPDTRIVEEAAALGATVSVDERRGISSIDGIPLVVDEELPAFPGFEVHRVCVPTARTAA